MSDPGLNSRFKFLSKWLMNRTPNIESIIQDLVHIDEEFESFARTFIANPDSNFTNTNINIINTTAADLAVPAETLQRQNFSKKVKWTSPDLSPSPMIEPQPELEPELHQDQDAIASEVDVSMQDTTFNEQGPRPPPLRLQRFQEGRCAPPFLLIKVYWPLPGNNIHILRKLSNITSFRQH